MKLLRHSLLLLTLTAPLALAAETPAPAPAADSPPITFLDSTLFDNLLSRELGKGKNEVEVHISGKISLNNIPPRVDKWITAVAEEGEVTLKPADPALKPKFILALLPVVYSLIKQANAERTMSSAGQYNANVIYHIDRSGESVIDKIVFIKKKP